MITSDQTHALRALINQFNRIPHAGFHSRDVFRDWIDFCSLSLMLCFPATQRDVKFERYTTIRQRYTTQQIEQFSNLFDALMTACCPDNKTLVFYDFIGEMYMQLEISNDRTGQFFTPNSLSDMLADISCRPDPLDFLYHVREPACGSGRLLVASAKALHSQNFDYQHRAYMTAIDIDPLCTSMTYLNCFLYCIAAQIVTGNGLNGTQTDVAYSPLYFINSFSQRLDQDRQFRALRALLFSQDDTRPAPVVSPCNEDPSVKLMEPVSTTLPINSISQLVLF